VHDVGEATHQFGIEVRLELNRAPGSVGKDEVGLRRIPARATFPAARAVMWCVGPRHAHHQSGPLGHLGITRASLRPTSGLSQLASANNPSAIRTRTTRGKRS
jgi:hypothetical protein